MNTVKKYLYICFFFFFDLWHWAISLFAHAARWSSEYLTHKREGTVYAAVLPDTGGRSV